ncbi:GNAT family N-acetyltransferase [Deinococcus cavernae]|uniref:GNAT family N-acetyltransferase n=1 Tax=Deinococcus cavernae TaxID=2320857 RepID=A0A418V988_9DEIO|nr:GNAT family N-acetyltransferase [Deinococcus cavernae]RJF72691.1 GNAT family N-acetyltransferase [Deinococcus cavernae]
MLVRPVQPDDYAAWRPLYDSYNAFYGREGATALSDERVGRIWARFFDPTEPVFALVAEQDGRLLGLTHDLFHRSVLHLKDMCYLQDLFTLPEARGRGVGQALIEGVYARAAEAGCPRVYWQTQESNLPGRRLYDQVAQHRGFIVYTHELER